MTTPIWDPIVALLKSRAFILSIITVIVDTIILVIPALEPIQDELVTTTLALVLALIGKMAVEDGAEKFGAARSQAQIESAQNASGSTPHR